MPLPKKSGYRMFNGRRYTDTYLGGKDDAIEEAREYQGGGYDTKIVKVAGGYRLFVRREE